MWGTLKPLVVFIYLTILCHSIETKPIGETGKMLEGKFVSSIVNSMRKLLENKTEKPRQKCTQITGPVIERALHNLQDLFPRKISIIPYAVVEPVVSGTLLFILEEGSSIVNITRFSVISSVNSTGNDSQISVSLGFDSINLAGDYQLDVDSFSIHVFGDGTYNFTLQDLSLSFTSNMHVEENKFQITDFSFNATVNNSQISITGLLDGNTGVLPILEVVGLAIPEEVDAAVDIYQELAQKYVMYFINTVLAPLFSWDDIVWLMCTLAGYID